MASPRSRPIVLVLYYWRGEWPLRLWERSHILAWSRYARSRVVNVNIAYPLSLRALRELRPDLVVFHATALSTRYRPYGFERLVQAAEALPAGAVRVASPLDEHLDAARLRRFMSDARVDIVLTPADAGLWPTLYGERPTAQLRTVLTGYLDPSEVAWMRRRAGPIAARPVALGYRADVQSWTGRFGALKKEIGDRGLAIAREVGLRADISTSPADRLVGRAWLQLLLRSRAVLGVEGGASALDEAGRVREGIRGSTAPVLPDTPNFGLRALSPRHLEAAAAGTGQILVRGRYSGVLEAGRHYIPVAGDLSDLREAIGTAQDQAALQRMVDRARREVVDSGQYGWPERIRALEAELIGP